jgi:hypothetical protein
MNRPIIEKRAVSGRPPPNMANYDSARAAFSWDEAARALTGLPKGRGLNIAHEAVDRHADSGRGQHVALRWLARDGMRRDISYAELKQLTSRFASGLAARGISKGDRVFTLLGRVPELYIAALGALKHRAVYFPLFSAFGPEPVQSRLDLGSARVLVASPALYQKKVRAIRASLPLLRTVLLIGERDPGLNPGEVEEFDAFLDRASDRYEIQPTAPEDMALLHFTSGTTGKPKGAVHVHQAVVAHHATGRVALDLHPDDIFWCTADPGWVTGTSYGIISPFEHAMLYAMEGELPVSAGAVDIDRAAIRRAGKDISLITYGGSLHKALAAADQLATLGIEAEVVDLRTLRPLDDETIISSVRRTQRAVIVDEAWRSGSLAAEISARIVEQAFYDLDAPVQRVCSAEVPIPYAKHLEDAALPSPERIVQAAKAALGEHHG